MSRVKIENLPIERTLEGEEGSGVVGGRRRHRHHRRRISLHFGGHGGGVHWGGGGVHWGHGGHGSWHDTSYWHRGRTVIHGNHLHHMPGHWHDEGHFHH